MKPRTAKRSLAILLALLLSLSFLTMGVSAADTVTIDLYSFNDFHGTVDKSASGSNPGADRFVAILEELTKDNPNSVIFSAGDSYQGSPLSNLFSGEPVSKMIKHLGVEYSALGNHEFDWGQERIYKFIEDGGITFLSANIFLGDTEESPDYCEPYAVIEVDGVKIGIIGLITTEMPTLVKADAIEGLTFGEPAESVAKWEPYLRDEENCDIVIALTHLGAEDEAMTLAKTEAGSKLDGIFGGHQHRLVNIEVNGVPILSALYNGRGVSRLTFEFDKGAGKIVDVKARAYSQPEMNGDDILPSQPLVVNEEIKAMVAGYADEAGPLFARGVGVYGMNIFSREDQADWGTKVVWDYISRETGENYVLFQNSGGWRDTSPYNRMAADIVTMGYLYTVMPFDNEIVLMQMKGSDLLADLLSDEAEVTGTKCIAGAELKDGAWVLSSGEEIKDDDTLYFVACNDFMLTGGDGYNFKNKIDDIFMGVPLRDAMIDELMHRAGIKEQLDPPYAKDLVANAWYEEAISFVIENNLISPLGVLAWEPNTTVNRATAFEALYRLEGSPAVEGENFADVKETDWFHNAALWAKNTGVSLGTGGNFLGADRISRSQLAAIFVRYLEIKGYELETLELDQYSDVGKIPTWAVEEGVFEKVVGTGIVTGISLTELAPVNSARRIQLAQMLLNMVDYLETAVVVEPEPPEEVPDAA